MSNSVRAEFLSALRVLAMVSRIGFPEDICK